MATHKFAPRELTVTVDVEDPRSDPRLPKVYDRVVRDLLEFLAEVKVRATFFVVGELAAADPDLVRAVSTAGHELGLHGWQHTPLPDLTPAEFRTHSEKGKAVLEDITGQAVIGFRAPIFSLTAATPWAEQILAEGGYRYSSSLLPGQHPFHSFPGAPRHAFRWPSGLVEIPSPIARIGPLRIPYLGGFYLRYLPYWYIKRSLGKADPGESLWCYSHPHDFDDGEPFRRIKNTPMWMSWLLWLNRRGTWNRLRTLLTDDRVITGAPFADLLLAGKFEGAPTFETGRDSCSGAK